MATVTSKINQDRARRVALKRIEGFTKQFGKAHRDLALHAAFPLALTPDLLYQIWANFVPEAPWTAVAHVLLSRLCREVGYEMYEMEISDRNLLLRELKKEFGQQRLDELAEFLLDYVAQRLTEDEPDIRDLREAQEWTALAYTKPSEVARELAEALGERVKQEDVGEVLRLASLVETLAEPLLEAGFEPLLLYSREMASFARNDIGSSRKESEKNVLLIPRQLSTTVRLIGDRESGKTTYMAALARWPGVGTVTSPVQMVAVTNSDGEELVIQAKNILEQGEHLLAAELYRNVYDDVKGYGLQIVLKDQFSWRRPWTSISSPLVKLNIYFTEYSGEFFQDLLYKSNTPLLQDHLEDCVKANSIMFLIDGLAYRKDTEYANGLDKFLIELDQAETGVGKRRIALVITKCEQPELWVNRHKPRQVVMARFPQVMMTLQTWEQSGAGSFNCFATSAFGILGKRYSEPNVKRIRRDREGIRESVLKNPQRWKPFGLVAPLYWLCTGERHMKLEQD